MQEAGLDAESGGTGGPASGGAGGGGGGGSGGGKSGTGGGGSGGSAGQTAGIGGAPLAFCEQSANAGKPCDDGRYCTIGEACGSRRCAGGTAVSCVALDSECQIGVCSETDKKCVAMAVPDGTACGTGEKCEGGDCVCPGRELAEASCGDQMDTDCDGQVDCADSDCRDKSCGGVKTCCPGSCVDTNTDENNCGGCGFVCPRPPPQGAASGNEECVTIEFCYDNPDRAWGTVCRTNANCVIRDNIKECESEATSVCGPQTPFWFCNASSTDCLLLKAPNR